MEIPDPSQPSRRAVLKACGGLAASALAASVHAVEAPICATRVERLAGNPIVRPGMEARMGHNVQGPSLIRVPHWLPSPLGRYYLYFADHKGAYIRLAFADALEGPWRIHAPGTLRLEQSHFPVKRVAIPARIDTADPRWTQSAEGVPTPIDSATLPHIASPDVHVREDRREIVMYFHGLAGFRSQHSRVATSRNGIDFTARRPAIARSYLRMLRHDGRWYGLAMPGYLYRSPDGLEDFEEGPQLFPDTMRHAALLKRGRRLFVFWTRVGDSPEHILLSTVELDGDWSTWRAGEPQSVLRPEEPWEGGDLPLAPSVRDAINVRVRQLRDPAVFQEDGRTYLLYAVAGEAGIAIARLDLEC
ncbi:MAG: hypothetical protein R3190_12145 [Thermoanaerobaculia bacterium]|nr:hypothetical protein [Thermoanaerobaculia bacterium]